MDIALRLLKRLLSNGTVRAAIYLAIMLILWSSFQIGGLRSHLINSYLVLALPLVVASMGVTLVIIMGQFDLSAAGVVTLIDVLAATKFTGLNPWLMFCIMLAIGVGIGLVNGLLVIYGRLPAIAVTLATLIILQGLSTVLLPAPGGVVPQPLIDAITTQSLIPRSLIFLVLVGIGWMLFKRTRLGIFMFALGADEEALRLSGVSIKPVRLGIFGLAGAAYALAGVLIAISTGTGDASIGSTFLLSTFAAVAIGGTAFVGGGGSALGSLFAALVLVAIPKVLFVLQVSSWLAQVVTGLIILVAVLAGAIANNRAIRSQMLALRSTDNAFGGRLDIKEAQAS